MQGFLIISVAILIIAGIVGLVMFLGKKRQEALQAIARQLNLKFFPKGSDSLAPLLSNLEFFSQGTHQRVRNLIKGKITRQGKSLSVAIFDYYYTVGHHNNVDTFVQTVLLFYDNSLNVPCFSLRPEHLFDKLGNILGFEDINFFDFPVFSQRYRLQSNQPGEVRSLFQSNLIKFYEGQKICTEAHGPYVLIFPSNDEFNRSNSIRMEGTKTFTESRLIQPNEIKTYLDIGLKLLNLLERNAA